MLNSMDDERLQVLALRCSQHAENNNRIVVDSKNVPVTTAFSISNKSVPNLIGKVFILARQGIILGMRSNESDLALNNGYHSNPYCVE